MVEEGLVFHTYNTRMILARWRISGLLSISFEILKFSRLSVSFSKSRLWGFNVYCGILDEVPEILGCVIGRGKLSYLGINIGINYRRSDS